MVLTKEGILTGGHMVATKKGILSAIPHGHYEGGEYCLEVTRSLYGRGHCMNVTWSF